MRWSYPVVLALWSCGHGAGSGVHDGGLEPADVASSIDSGDVDLDAATQSGAVSDCAVDDMLTLYPGFLPTNPFVAPPPASACMNAQHDVIIVLGCPNDSDGTSSQCQEQRADIAVALAAAGLGKRFITTGAAVKNPHVEAQTLRDLLIARGVASADIYLDELAQHTDENLYYSSLIMADHGWQNALVVSDDPGHLIMTAVCDSNCCVDLGRITIAGFAIVLAGAPTTKAVGHYVRYPFTPLVSGAECTQIEMGTKLMCTNLASRRACAGNLMLP